MTQQIPFHDRSKDAFSLEEIDPDSIGLHKLSNDAMGPSQLIGNIFYILMNPIDLLILKGIPYFADSSSFTCFPHAKWLVW